MNFAVERPGPAAGPPPCGTCPCCVLVDVGRGECHLEPPKSFVFLTQQGPIEVAQWPTVPTTRPGCSHHPRWGAWAGRHAQTIGAPESPRADNGRTPGPRTLIEG